MLRASVIGGGWGGRLSMIGLTDSGRYSLVAACDLRADVCHELQGFYPGLATYTDANEMFAARPVDVICVSTFPSSHEELTLQAIEQSPKGLLVEKPLGHTVASGRRLLDAIKAAGLPVVVPHGLATNSHALEIVRRVRAGEIGELRLVEVQHRGWDVMNAGIHWAHFFVTLTNGDAVEWVLAGMDRSTCTYRDGMQVETLSVTTAQTRSGVRLVMHMGDHTAVNVDGREIVFRLIGTDGVIEFYGWDADFRIQNAEHPAGATFEPARTPETNHQIHLEHLARQIDQGRTDYALAEASLTALEISEGAYRSAREGRLVRIPLPETGTASPPAWAIGEPWHPELGGRDGRRLEDD